MSEETKTELKLPKAYVRPSLAEFTGPGHRYPAERYESFFARVEQDLAAKYASGEVTDENFVDIRDHSLKLPAKYKRPTVDQFVQSGYEADDYEAYFERHEADLAEAYASGRITDANFGEIYGLDEMTDADGDGLPDILHVRSQVRAQSNRTQRARHPTRHRFKQYLFADPSKRLVRKRPLRVSAELVRANIDELIEKERIGILSVHAPNGARIDLAALKAGRVVMAAVAPTPALPNPPLDSAANDTPAGENMQQYLGGTFVNDPAADAVLEDMTAEKEAEVAKKETSGLPPGPAAPPALPASTEAGDFVDPAAPDEPPAPPAPAPAPAPDEPAAPVVSTELEQPPMGVDGNTAPIQPAPNTDTETSVETPTAPAFQGEAPEQQASTPVEAEEQDRSAIDPVDEPTKVTKGKKGGGRR